MSPFPSQFDLLENTSRGPIRIARVLLLKMLVVLLVIASSSFAADEPSLTPLSPEQQRLIGQLSSADFQERVRAQRELATLAEAAPELVANLLPKLDSEAQDRLCRLLEGVLLKHDDERGDRAERALEQISRSASPAALEAEAILRCNDRLRESRARAALERLGAQLSFVYPSEGRSAATSPGIGVGFGESAVLDTILILASWKGTPADLWHLKRLSRHQELRLYNIRGSRVPLEDLLRLAAVLPGLMVAERGGCLGIRATPTATAAQVYEVVPNSAAMLAGLQPLDVIERLGPDKVRNFSHLVELLLQYGAGETVMLEVLRNGETLKIPVTLSSWTEIQQSEQFSVPAPAPFAGPLGQSRPVPVPLPEPIPQVLRQPPRFQ
jgi:hypothetical protein